MTNPPRAKLPPDWKKRLTVFLAELGLLDIPYGQIVLNVADGKIMDAEKRERVK
jgi:hypothetical protein